MTDSDSNSTHTQPSSLWSHGPADMGMPMESNKTKKTREIRAGFGLCVLTVLIVIALCLIFIPGGIL